MLSMAAETLAKSASVQVSLDWLAACAVATVLFVFKGSLDQLTASAADTVLLCVLPRCQVQGYCCRALKVVLRDAQSWCMSHCAATFRNIADRAFRVVQRDV